LLLATPWPLFLTAALGDGPEVVAAGCAVQMVWLPLATALASNGYAWLAALFSAPVWLIEIVDAFYIVRGMRR